MILWNRSIQQDSSSVSDKSTVWGSLITGPAELKRLLHGTKESGKASMWHANTVSVCYAVPALVIDFCTIPESCRIIWVTGSTAEAGVKFGRIPTHPRSGASILGSGICLEIRNLSWEILWNFAAAQCHCWSSLLMTVTSMYLKNFHFSMRLLSFLVTERCGDRHKLVVRSYFVLADYHNFILEF